MGENCSALETDLHEELLKQGFRIVGQIRNDCLASFLKNSSGFCNYNPNIHEYAVLPITLLSVEDIKESLPGFTDHDNCPLKYFVYMREKK